MESTTVDRSTLNISAGHLAEDSQHVADLHWFRETATAALQSCKLIDATSASDACKWARQVGRVVKGITNNHGGGYELEDLLDQYLDRPKPYIKVLG